MQQALQITFRGIDHSDAVESRIRGKAVELERFSDITSCHVTVDAQHRHHHHGNVYSVRVDVHVPGKEICVGRERGQDHSHEDVYVAIRDAFNATIRALEDYTLKRHGKVKVHETPDYGRVTRIYPAESYGFVQRSDGMDVYFHAHSVLGKAFDDLGIGDEVRILVVEGEGRKGPQASAVIPIGKHHVGETSV